MRETIVDKVKRRLQMSASNAALWSPDKAMYRYGWKSGDWLTLPDFLGIGVQKAGTTWLWANLRCHPDLFLPERKELHYFNLYFYKSLSSYATRFEGAEGKTKGEITPAYGILPPRKIRFISKVMPSVKLILILRNPIDRAWSRAKMMLRNTRGVGEVELTGVGEREILRAVTHRSSRARGDYLSMLDNWLLFFPPEQLHLCFYEDLAQRPMEFLKAIFSFLDVHSDVDWSRFPYRTLIGQTGKTEIPEKYRKILEGMYCDSIAAMYERFGPRIESWRHQQRDASDRQLF